MNTDKANVGSSSSTPESLGQAVHMPGPWEVVRTEARYAIYSDTYRIASVHDFNGWPINGKHASLIAAAPDLLALLRKCREFADSVHDGEYGYSDCTRDELVEQIDAVLTKASKAA
jgi:hypothetical protein